VTQTIIHPPKSMLEVWESLPEGTLCQLINNKLVMSPASQNLHQVVLFEIAFNLETSLNKSHLGEFRIAPFDVYFSNQNILQPDILFVSNKNLQKINKDGLKGAPDLVIEILSPSTSQIDYEEKKSVYERFGVQEYFIVEPNTKSVDSFFLKNNEYEMKEVFTGKINSEILGIIISF
jgi:Uma2 family endonuclease